MWIGILKKIAEQFNKFKIPWVLIGDMNLIFDQSEKMGGLPFNKNHSEYYNNTLKRDGLFNIGYIGYEFTWNNNKKNLQTSKRD